MGVGVLSEGGGDDTGDATVKTLLIVWIATYTGGQYSGYNRAVTFQQFETQQACEAIAARINRWDGPKTGYRNGSIAAECVSK